jgi:hypothetical protein
VFQGLKQGLNQGLLSGLNSKWGPSLLADLDFSTPVTQAFPTTGAVLGQTATGIWDFQEASGDVLDKVGSIDLGAVGSPIQNQTAVGLWDGSSYTSRKAMENITQRGSNYVDAASTSTYDFDASTSFAFMVVVRAPDQINSARVLRKFVGGVGYEIVLTPSAITCEIDDGVTSGTATVTEFAGDGAWHCILFIVNRTTNKMHCITDLGSTTDVDIASVGSLSSAALFGTGSSGATSRAQWTYMVHWQGAAAEALDQTAFDAFWQHASDPTGLLTTQTRGSLISVPVANGYVGHFTDDTLPIGWHSGLGGTGLGLYMNTAVTNLCADSEDLTSGWVATSTDAVTANDDDAPDGFRSATLVDPTNTAGRVHHAIASGLVAETEYTLSYWAKADVSHATEQRVTTSSSVNTSLASQSPTITTSWVRYTLTFTTGVGQTSTRILLYGDTTAGTDTCHYWGVQIELGDGAGAYIRTSGGSAALVKSDFRATGDYVQFASGEAHAVFIRDKVEAVNAYVFATNNTADDRSLFYRNVTGNPRAIVDNAAGGNEATLNGLTSFAQGVEANLRMVWDSSAAGVDGFRARLAEVGVSTRDSAASPWVGSASAGFASEIKLGQNWPGNAQLDGFLQSLKLYDGKNGDLP